MGKIKILCKKFINFSKILIFADYSFRYPEKKKILLFDNNLEFFLKKYVNKNQYTVLFSRHKKYNFLIILKLIFKFRFSSLNYFNDYIEYVDPKILITFSDNYPIFYKLKVPKNTKKIFAQAANRTKAGGDVFDKIKELKKSKKFNKVDEMLVFNKKVGEEYKKFIHGNVRVIGSIRSNAFNINLKKKKFDMFYISTWRDHDVKSKFTKTVNWQRIISSERTFLEKLKNFSIRNNRHLTVYGKYNSLKEEQYFTEIFDKTNWKFLKNDRMKSYKYCDAAKLIISSSSTLGYEALARGSKVVFFNYIDFDQSTKSKNFCWPYKIAKRGAFWTNDISQNSCNKIINYVSKLSSNSWKKIYLKEFKKINFINYDRNNSILRSLIK